MNKDRHLIDCTFCSIVCGSLTRMLSGWSLTRFAQAWATKQIPRRLPAACGQQTGDHFDKESSPAVPPLSRLFRPKLKGPPRSIPVSPQKAVHLELPLKVPDHGSAFRAVLQVRPECRRHTHPPESFAGLALWFHGTPAYTGRWRLFFFRMVGIADKRLGRKPALHGSRLQSWRSFRVSSRGLAVEECMY